MSNEKGLLYPKALKQTSPMQLSLIKTAKTAVSESEFPGLFGLNAFRHDFDGISKKTERALSLFVKPRNLYYFPSVSYWKYKRSKDLHNIFHSNVRKKCFCLGTIVRNVFFHAPYCAIIYAVLEVMLLKESDFLG